MDSTTDTGALQTDRDQRPAGPLAVQGGAEQVQGDRGADRGEPAHPIAAVRASAERRARTDQHRVEREERQLVALELAEVVRCSRADSR
jgi:hypothetical protein